MGQTTNNTANEVKLTRLFWSHIMNKQGNPSGSARATLGASGIPIGRVVKRKTAKTHIPIMFMGVALKKQEVKTLDEAIQIVENAWMEIIKKSIQTPVKLGYNEGFKKQTI